MGQCMVVMGKKIALPVSGGDVPQDPSHVDGPAHEGYGVEDGYPDNVEAEVDQGYLQCLHIQNYPLFYIVYDTTGACIVFSDQKNGYLQDN